MKTMNQGRSDTRVMALAWTAAFLLAVVLIPVTGFVSADPDSKLYADISSRLSMEPITRWIAPEWWGFWNSDGLYFEHPVGLFVVSAALARVGYPVEQAAYAVNALYQVLSFVLIAAIAASVLPAREARALGWLLQLLPIAFVFRVRANHEYAVLAGALFAIYATERSRRHTGWTVGMLAGFLFVLCIKGIFAFIVPVTCALWLFAREGLPGRAGTAWAAVIAMPFLGGAAAWVYDAAYIEATGRSFLAMYGGRQLPQDAMVGGFSVLQAFYNGLWYAGRIAWYAFPWSILAAILAVGAVRNAEWWPERHHHGGSASRHPPYVRASSSDGDRQDARQAAWFAIVSALALAGAFSLAHRKADRYIFPVYFLTAAAGAVYGMRRFPWFSGFVARVDRPWTGAALYAALLLLRLATLGRLPEFVFWRS